MSKGRYIGAFLLVAIAIAAAFLLLAQNNEPSHRGHRLGWWVDQYGNFEYPAERRAEAKEALLAIGTNAVPYLVNWIRNVDAEPASNLHPADKDAFRKYTGERAASAAFAFSALGTNAEPVIPTLKAMVANATNGNVCILAERALVRMGPEGFAAVLDVIDTPGLPQRGVIMQGSELAEHLRPPDATTLAGHEDPNFRTNSIRAAPVLLKCLGDNDTFVRQCAFRLLCFSDSTATVPALTNFISDSPPPEIRRQATEALAKHGTNAAVAVPFLLARFNSSDPEIRGEATNAIAQIAPEILAARPSQSSP